MTVKEHVLGKGTIAYAGESAEYWAAKSAKLRRGRARITVALAVVALALMAWLVSPFGPRIESAVVTGSADSATTSQVSVIQVHLADGRAGSYSSTTRPPTGLTVTVTAFADGHVIEGTGIVISLWAIALVAGGVAAGRGAWQFRRRHTVTTFR